MTTLRIDPRATWLDRTAVRLGSILTDWGTSHAALRTTPSYAEQTERVEQSRLQAARSLPQLPR